MIFPVSPLKFDRATQLSQTVGRPLDNSKPVLSSLPNFNVMAFLLLLTPTGIFCTRYHGR